jgi:Protein of unknown function (DUF4238)
MAANKKQHYVPKFYLSNFAADPDGKTICVFNLNAEKFIPSAGITGQCYRPYFYGKDTPTEKSLGQIEGDAGSAIARMIETSSMKECPNAVRLHIAIQLSRTAGALAEMREMLGHFEKHAPPDMKKPLGDVDAINMSVQVSIMASPVIDDLSSCLIVNESGVNFFTSDHPVARVNRFHTEAKFPGAGGGTGLSQAGLEILLPISPRHAILLLDSNIYAISGRTGEGTVTVRRDDEARTVNDLQVLTATQNLYTSDPKCTWQPDQISAPPGRSSMMPLIGSIGACAR